MTRADVLARIAAGRVIAVVRPQELPEATALCSALCRGGIGAVELTFTTPDLLVHLAKAAETSEATGSVVGAGLC